MIRWLFDRQAPGQAPRSKSLVAPLSGRGWIGAELLLRGAFTSADTGHATIVLHECDQEIVRAHRNRDGTESACRRQAPIARNPPVNRHIVVTLFGSAARGKLIPKPMAPEMTRPMNKIAFEDGTFSVDAAVIAAGLGLPADAVQQRMREGKITSLCERGIDEDAGRFRLTFFHARRRFRIVVDESGHVIDQSVDRVRGRR